MLGSHVNRENGVNHVTALTNTLTALREVRPAQMFLSSTRSAGSHHPKDDEAELLRQLIASHNLPMYVHTPYCVNLSGTPSKFGGTTRVEVEGKDWKASDFWALKGFCADIELTSKIGGRGVVVHTGCHCDRCSVEDGVDRMQYAINKCLPSATEACPILLETPAGNGTHLLNTIQEMAAFYVRFGGDPRLKVCIDTMHVFGAGYEPIQYLKLWCDTYGSASVGLVHFNDSKVEKGARLDSHHHFLVEGGHIGMGKMMEIRKYCEGKGINMVTE